MNIVRLPPTGVSLTDCTGRRSCRTAGRRRALVGVIGSEFAMCRDLDMAAGEEAETLAGRERDSARRAARDAEFDAIS
jgi:hypothetical protein